MNWDQIDEAYLARDWDLFMPLIAPYIETVARRICSDPSSRDDIVQILSAQIVRYRDSYLSSRGLPRGWIKCIIASKAATEVKKRQVMCRHWKLLERARTRWDPDLTHARRLDAFYDNLDERLGT